jgi:hypothetical protein
MTLQPVVGPWPLFQFLNLYTVGRTPWTRDQYVARPLLHTQNERTQTSTPGVGFETTTPVFERAKTVHASGLAATVIGMCTRTSMQSNLCCDRKDVSSVLNFHIFSDFLIWFENSLNNLIPVFIITFLEHSFYKNRTRRIKFRHVFWSCILVFCSNSCTFNFILILH